MALVYVVVHGVVVVTLIDNEARSIYKTYDIHMCCIISATIERVNF
jgi:hypothetical protein